MQTMKPVTKPTKQRRMLYQAPDHIRHRLFAAPLSSELKASQGVKALPVRSGDTVRIMRGDHKGFEGKITDVDRKKYRIYVEGLTREKVDGTTIFVPIHPSKVMITKLNLDDKWRKEVLQRKKEVGKKAEEVVEKPTGEVVKAKEEAIEEKVTVEKKPKRRRRKAARKPAVKKAEEKAKVTKKEETPKARKKREVAEKTEGGT